MEFINTYYKIPKSSYDSQDYTITAESDLPEEFCLPGVPVKNQGLKPTCTAHALASAAEYHYQRQHGTYEAFSTEFIYAMREDGDYKGDGLSVRQGLNTLLKYGVPFERDCPGNHDYKSAKRNVEGNLEELKELAYPHRIGAYFKINTADEIKTALVKYGVVIVVMRISERDEIVDGVYTVGKSKKSLGVHTVFVYGWNKTGWLVQDSRRAFGWDDRYTVPFGYQFLEKWGIVDDITEGVLDKPKRNKLLDLIFKIIKFIVNLFN